MAKNSSFVYMRRLIALLFMFAFLCSNTEAGQLLKAHRFITHYKEHRLANPEMGLFAFFQLHYFTDGPHDNEDMKLPFKQHHDCCAGTNLLIFIPHSMPVITANEVIVSQLYSIHTEQTTEDAFKGAVFQPPRFS